jgi:hypothetical protein
MRPGAWQKSPERMGTMVQKAMEKFQRAMAFHGQWGYTACIGWPGILFYCGHIYPGGKGS